MSDQQPTPQRKSEPLLDSLGKAIAEGRDAAEFLWQVPDDADTRDRMVVVLEFIQSDTTKKGRREMPKICEELLVALRATPSPQQVDLLQTGFDRLYKLWRAAKSGLV